MSHIIENGKQQHTEEFGNLLDFLQPKMTEMVGQLGLWLNAHNVSDGDAMLAAYATADKFSGYCMYVAVYGRFNWDESAKGDMEIE